MQDISRQMKRLVRKFAGIAHDRELSAALLELRSHFDRWQRGEIMAADLNELVHQFHQGRSRHIWAKYATNHSEPALASAVATGLLKKEELPEELLTHLARAIEFYEADQSA